MKVELDIPHGLYRELERLSDIYETRTGNSISPTDILMCLAAVRITRNITPIVLVNTIRDGLSIIEAYAVKKEV